MDGWRASEIKALPLKILDRLASVFDKIETSGVWPDALTYAAITLIPKGAGGDPLDLRPITVASVIYRLWAATRCREVMSWQNSWLATGQTGFAHGKGCADTFMKIALLIEKSLLDGTPLVGFSADWAKCFDRIPHTIMLNVLERLGLHSRVLCPLRTMYASLLRCFKINGAVGQFFRSTQGILQGCPLSVVGLNAMMSVLSRAVESRAPGAEYDSFADDGGITATAPTRETAAATVQQGVAEVDRFAGLTGGEIHLGKSHSWCTDKDFVLELQCGGKKVKREHSARLLGAFVRYDNTTCKTPEWLTGRFAKLKQFCSRAGQLPYPSKLKEQFISAGPIASVVNGCTAVHPFDLRGLGGADRLLHSSRTAVANALMDHHNRRCPELLLTLFTRQHRCDPASAIVYRVLSDLRILLTRREPLMSLTREVLHLHHKHPSRCGFGPAVQFHKAAKAIGWKLDIANNSVVIRDAKSRSIDCTAITAREWEHRVRDGLRSAAWSIAEQRHREGHSNGLAGISDGIDIHATLALYELGRLPPRELGFLRVILTYGIYSTERLFQMQLDEDPVDSPFCPWCEKEGVNVPESIHHMFWDCPHWDHIRRQHSVNRLVQAVRANDGGIPRCLSNAGLVPTTLDAGPLLDGDTTDAILARRGRRPAARRRPAPRPPPVASEYGSALGPNTPIDDGCRDTRGIAWIAAGGARRMIIFVDGAAAQNADSRFRRAGYGIYFGPAHPDNISTSVPAADDEYAGLSQDSEYVYSSLSNIEQWRQFGWRHHLHAAQHIEHHDLWARFHELRAARPPLSTHIVWVKGHVGAAEVEARLATPFNQNGNAAADALAVAGAALHAVPRAAIQRARAGGARARRTTVHARRHPRPRRRAAGAAVGAEGGAAGAARRVRRAGTRKLRYATKQHAHTFPLGARYAAAIRQWLCAVRWPQVDPQKVPDTARGVTWVELAADFELFTGIDIPPFASERKAFNGTAFPYIFKVYSFNTDKSSFFKSKTAYSGKPGPLVTDLLDSWVRGCV
eukprot:gene6768-biopygen36539